MQQPIKCFLNFSKGQDIKMKPLLLLLFTGCYNFCMSQDVSWQKFQVDSNLTIEFPGLAQKQPSVKFDKYSYDAYSYETGRLMFQVLVGTSEQEINVRNKEDYEDALSDMAEGVKKGGTEKGWAMTFTDIMIDSVPGKKMSYKGKLSGIDAIGNNYLFLVNGLSYSINAIFVGQNLSANDSLQIDRYISSIDFTNNIREQQFDTRSESVAYMIGKAIGGLVVLGVVMFVIILIVRRL